MSSNAQRNHSATPTPATQWPHDLSHEAHLTIGRVHEILVKEFPSLQVSKIRFLEQAGLIEPQRTNSGFRIFSDAEVERLRYILQRQRDSFLSLPAIGLELQALDAGHEVKPEPTARIVTDRGRSRLPSGASVSVRELCDLTGINKQTVETYVKHGLLTPDMAGYFPARSVKIVQLIGEVESRGLGARYLRSVRNSAERHVDLVDQSVDPLRARGRSLDHERADAMERDLSELICDLYREFSRLSVDRLQP